MDKLTFLITIRSAERRTYFTLDADYVYFSTWPSSFKIECMLGGEFLCCATDLEGSTDSPLFGLWIIDSFHTERERERACSTLFSLFAAAAGLTDGCQAYNGIRRRVEKQTTSPGPD